MIPPPAPATEPLGRQHFRTWLTLVIPLVPAGLLFAWAGSGQDPRNAVPWTWTKTGWIVPAAGLAWIWFWAAILFWLLSHIAWLLFHPVPGSTRLKVWASVGIVLGLGLLLRIMIASTWTPLPLDAAALSGPILPGGTAWRWAAILGDLAVTGLLMTALAGAGRSVWWAALYALHPVVMLEVAGNGHWIAWAMVPVVFVAGISHRVPRIVVQALPPLAAVGVLLAMVFSWPAAGFNSLAWAVAQTFGIQVILPIFAALLLAGVVVFARLREWPLPRTLVHIAIVALMCSPAAPPWCAVAVAALLPLAWAHAGWILSLTMLAAFAAIPAMRLGYGFRVPEWLLMFQWIPVWVLETRELGVEGLAASRLFRRKPFAADASPVP